MKHFTAHDLSCLSLDSPMGRLALSASEGEIVQLTFDKKMREYFWDSRDERILREGANQLEEYFSGHLSDFDLPLNLRQGSEYQEQVWNELRRIPFGKTLSYGELASQVSSSTSARAVAQACGANPLLILVPCHRILRANAELGGFSAGLNVKKKLLNFEGSSYRE